MIRIDMDLPDNCMYCPFCYARELINDDNETYYKFECLITGEYIPDEILNNYKLFELCPIEEDMLI